MVREVAAVLVAGRVYDNCVALWGLEYMVVYEIQSLFQGLNLANFMFKVVSLGSYNLRLFLLNVFHQVL